MGRLTTHILDTAAGSPGANIAIELYRCSESGPEHLNSLRSNADGRCEQPLLADAAMVVGVYELHFSIGDYYRQREVDLPEPAFLDTVVLRFGIADADAHYHVPLLVSPYGYSTYRGS